MERFLIDSFNAAYGLYQDIKTGNYREDREADELALKEMWQGIPTSPHSTVFLNLTLRRLHPCRFPSILRNLQN